MSDTVYWIWLQNALGVGNPKADWVIEQIGSPEKFYQMTEQALRDTGIFASKEIQKIKSAKLEDAEKALARAEKYGYSVITPPHPDYPGGFLHINAAPCALYAKGDMSHLEDELLITIVGTRSATQYGLDSAFRLAYDLAAAGCTVVSGLATGIDCAAHEGDLAAGGRTIGLLACGMDIDYPRASHDLKERILQAGGCFFSEFPFGMRAFAPNFNIRNRLVAGISSGVLVVQAPEKSGALNTARHAMEQGKDIFAVPGEIFDKSMVGCNRLIQDGCKMVLNVYSILEEYKGRFPDKIDPAQIVRKIQAASRKNTPTPHNLPRKVIPVTPASEPSNIGMVAQETFTPVRKYSDEELSRMELSETAKKIYQALDAQPADCETLAQSTGISASTLMAGLTELELSGLAQCHPGKRYTALPKI